MKILFLDIDGVLNYSGFFKGLGEYAGLTRLDQCIATIDPAAVAHLNAIVGLADAKVVISSSWRYGTPLPTIRAALQHHGFLGDIIGQTPKHIPGNRGSHRGTEIAAWLAEHPRVSGFVILDDDSDMEPHMDRLVKTHWTAGLQAHHIAQAVEILNRPWSPS